MNAQKFAEEIDRYLADVRATALQLFDSGVLSEHCLDLAQRAANSKATKRALERQQLAGPVTRFPINSREPTQ